MEKPFLGVDVVGIENILCHNGLDKLGNCPGTRGDERPQDKLEPSSGGKPVSEGGKPFFAVFFVGDQKSGKGSIDLLLTEAVSVVPYDIVSRLLVRDTCVEIENMIDFMR